MLGEPYERDGQVVLQRARVEELAERVGLSEARGVVVCVVLACSPLEAPHGAHGPHSRGSGRDERDRFQSAAYFSSGRGAEAVIA